MNFCVWKTILSGIFSLCLIVPTCALGAGGGKDVTKLINVADTRFMDGGISKWIADLYNESLILFGILVVVSMVFLGITFGFLADKVFQLLGIHLGKIEHHE